MHSAPMITTRLPRRDRAATGLARGHGLAGRPSGIFNTLMETRLLHSAGMPPLPASSHAATKPATCRSSAVRSANR